jgi:hypothetical protein
MLRKPLPLAHFLAISCAVLHSAANPLDAAPVLPQRKLVATR